MKALYFIIAVLIATWLISWMIFATGTLIQLMVIIALVSVMLSLIKRRKETASHN